MNYQIDSRFITLILHPTLASRQYISFLEHRRRINRLCRQYQSFFSIGRSSHTSSHPLNSAQPKALVLLNRCWCYFVSPKILNHTSSSRPSNS